MLKKLSVLRGFAGLSLGVVVLMAYKLAGLTGTLSWGDCLVAAIITFGLHAVLLLALYLGWDRLVPWDPHFLYLPVLAASLLLSFYAFLMPEGRVLVLMGWYVVLLFMAGLASFTAVLALSTVMVTGYAVVILYNRWYGQFELLEELALLVPFFVICVYAAFVHGRLRRHRDGLKELRVELSRQARTDALTGLPNRRHFEEALWIEVARCRRYGHPCAVAMIDVDNFKAHNDRLGHLAGDVILRELAVVIRDHCRVTDLAARYGGEEFAVILVNTGKADATNVLDRLRRVVGEQRFVGGDTEPANLTVSIGVAGLPDDPAEGEELVRRADEALYRAKREGRNRVCAEAS